MSYDYVLTKEQLEAQADKLAIKYGYSGREDAFFRLDMGVLDGTILHAEFTMLRMLIKASQTPVPSKIVSKGGLGRKLPTPQPTPKSAVAPNVARKVGRPKKDGKKEPITIALTSEEKAKLEYIQGVLGLGSLSQTVGHIALHWKR